MADEIVPQATSSGAASPAATAPEVPQVQTPPVSAVASSGAAAGSSGIANLGQTATPAATPAEQWQGVNDAMRDRYGLNLGVTDDNAALQRLAEAYRQSQQFAPLQPVLQQYQQHQEEFNAFLRQKQQEAAQAQAKQQQSWWKAPEYNPEWLNQVMQDPVTQRLVAKPGFPNDIPDRLYAAENHRREFLQNFARDPIKAIQPGIEQLATQIAMRTVQEHLGQFQQRSIASNFVQENSEWLHARDTQGRLIQTATGQPVLSPMGERFRDYVAEAQSMGIGNIDQQKRYAMTAVQRDYLMSKHQAAAGAQGAQAAGDQGKERFLANAAGAAGARGPGAAAATSPAATPPMRNSRDLAAVMLANLEKNGIRPGQPLEMAS